MSFQSLAASSAKQYGKCGQREHIIRRGDKHLTVNDDGRRFQSLRVLA